MGKSHVNKAIWEHLKCKHLLYAVNEVKNAYNSLIAFL